MVVTRFLRLLSAELEDCEEDLRDLDQLLAQRLASREITDYVYRENDALLKHEILAIRTIREAISGLRNDIAGDTSRTMAEVSQDALQVAYAEIVRHQYPLAVMPLIERRVQRIREFLGQETPSR